VIIKCATSAILALVFLWCLAAHGSELKLWYDEPAEFWVEALPIGNGSLGAMVFGGVPEERLQLNEDTLWTGSPHEYQHEGAAEILPELRRLLVLGEQQAAEELAAKSFMSIPLHQQAYQPMGDLIIEFNGHDEATEYRRELDLENAITRVSYQIDDVAYRRDTISSFPDQVIAQRLSTSRKGALGFSIQLTTPHSAGRIDAVDGNGLLLTGQVENPSGEEGLRFAMRVRVIPEGGELTIEDGLITVSEANAATILLSAATSYKSFSDISGDPVAATFEVLDQLQDKSFADIQSRHTEDYRDLFDRMSIDLGTSERADLNTYERLRHTNKSDDPALAALLVQYGRYLLISSSRAGSQPANLQGIWNDQLRPRWGSKYTTNINVEMNYWPAEVANLSGTAEPLFDLIDDLVISGRKTAKTHYDARGWVLHHNTDLWRASAPVNNSNHGIWPVGGAWLCQHLWEHFLYTGDKVFLRERAYPVMKEAALFLVDYLVEDPESGWLISGPSNSPEQGGLVMGPTMDHQIIRSLFANVIAASEILGEDPDFSAKLDSMRQRIAPNQIGQYGQLQEWLQDTDDPDNKHRHVSHLWGVFPGNEISTRTPAFLAAAKNSLDMRGDEGTGWSTGWKIALWARMRDGDRSHRLLMSWMNLKTPRDSSKGSGVYPNMLGAHQPFQIDGNFGATAGVLEMLVQSQEVSVTDNRLREIQLLPALPSQWPDGALHGVRARGGFELDIDWQSGELTSARIFSEKGGSAQLRYGSRIVDVELKAGQSETYGPALKREIH